MKDHLTERELIEYQFELVPDARLEKIAGHLQDCAQCRQRLEQLKRKFAALELLWEEIEPSDDLISRVLAEVSKPVRARAVSFRRPAWIGAAAAVLLMASLLLVSRLGREQIEPRGSVKKPIAEKPGVKFEGGAEIARAVKEKGSVEAELEEPPFAPASAIELVTLPRRENVQLTIYNSTFQELTAGYGYGGSGGYDSSGQYGRYDRYGERRDVSSAESAEFEGPGLDERTLKRIEQLKRLNNLRSAGKADERTLKRIARLKRQIEADLGAAQKRRQTRQPRPYRREITGAVSGGDLTLVRERRNLTLKKGWNWLQFMWANTLIDPTSLSLEPLEQKDKIDIQQLVFPARLRELGRWLIRSETSGRVPFEITYFTSGLTWRAFYMGTLAQDEKTMRLKGYVRITNTSGEDYENAQTRLVVGKVHILDQIIELAKRRYPYGSPVPEVRRGGYGGGGYGGARFDLADNGSGVPLLGDVPTIGGLFRYEARRKEIIKEGLSEYFLYTIEGKETIPNEWGKRLLSFEAEDIDVNSLYKYDEERWGRQTIRFVAFANDEEHNLGQTPIPDGQVKIYSQADEQGHLSYVGGTSIKYIPVDEEIELNLGSARLVSVEPVLMDFKTDNYLFDANDNIADWDEIRTWKMEITNARELQVEIEITRGFGTPYWKLQHDDKAVSYEMHDAEHARFKAQIPPRTKRKFNYTVTTYHGTRQEQFGR